MIPPDGDDGTVRSFETGATRDTAKDKRCYAGFFSFRVFRFFGEYMHKHRLQSDGSLRDADNWQKGIPLEVYMDSMYRHFMDVWEYHRRLFHEGKVIDAAAFDEALGGLKFNVDGMIHEREKAKEAADTWKLGEPFTPIESHITIGGSDL